MATDFIYILSSLPMLELDGDGAWEYDRFLETCENLVSAKEFSILEHLSLFPDASNHNPVLCGWRQWMVVMGNMMVKYRAKHLGVDPKQYLRSGKDDYPGDERVLDGIMSQPGLLAKQNAWEKLQWEKLQELEDEGGAFSWNALLVYALRLLILQNRRRYEQKAGREAFENLVSARLAEAAEARVLMEDK
ncbi:MAG: hypothetical protein MJ106_07395 [Lentisphaeria bacterium]|nr:hypothetical protein [Lentisphaeria bacterium]